MSKVQRTASGKSKNSPAAPAEVGEKARYAKLVEAVADKAPASLRSGIRAAAPAIATIIVGIETATPFVIKFVSIVEEQLEKIPEKIFYSIVGLVICFFGGIFPATIAAFEAWRLCGGAEAVGHLKVMYKQMVKVKTESAKDDKVDEDNDGIADVDQINAAKLLARKTMLAARTIDPVAMNQAITGLWVGWLGVLAVLKIQFAKTMTLGEIIGEKIYGVVSRAEPHLLDLCDDNYDKWIPCLLRWACKAVAMTIAWWIQRIISSFHSAIRGGFMCSKYLVEFLKDRNIINLEEKCGGYADDVVSWGVAFAGLLFQFTFRFGVPFPLNLVTWPLNIVEAFIVWSVAGSSAP